VFNGIQRQSSKVAVAVNMYLAQETQVLALWIDLDQSPKAMPKGSFASNSSHG
jgi:hypothetical protein